MPEATDRLRPFLTEEQASIAAMIVQGLEETPSAKWRFHGATDEGRIHYLKYWVTPADKDGALVMLDSEGKITLCLGTRGVGWGTKEWLPPKYESLRLGLLEKLREELGLGRLEKSPVEHRQYSLREHLADPAQRETLIRLIKWFRNEITNPSEEELVDFSKE